MIDGLSFFVLIVLVFVFVFLFLAYGLTIMHDIPYHIAVKRNHPHEDAIAQGQLQPTGAIVDPEAIHGEGRALARLKIEGDLSRFQLVPGTTGVVAVHTDHMHHLSVMRKVLLRMNSWTNYLFSDGH